MPLPSGVVKRRVIGGVPLYYERRDVSDVWGDLAPNEEASGLLMPDFAAELDISFTTLWGFIGKPDGIITAGAWVEKPGAHGIARAFDLDGFVYPTDGGPFPQKWNMTAFSTPEEQRSYMALMCHFSLTFGNVLGWYYNNAHKDHIHLDDLVRAGFRYNSHAVVTTIQGAIKHIWNEDIHIDGEWGPATRMAMVRRVPFNTMYPTDEQFFTFLVRSRDWVLAKRTTPQITSLSLEERVRRIEAFLSDAELAFSERLLKKHGLL